MGTPPGALYSWMRPLYTAARMTALVGISQCLDDRGRWRPGRDYVYVDLAYARAVEAAGGTPVHLPLQREPASLVARLDALLLPGGDDFLPPAGHPPYAAGVRFDPVPPAQLAFDAQLLAAALERGIPILGICYGMQLLALHHGGRLHYHLPVDRPDAGCHKLPEDAGRHPLETLPGSHLASILGDDPPPVNSLHHQAVADPGPGLAVSARSPDGVIEAIEGTGGAFVLGVQWHPEKQDDGGGRALFAAFVAAAQPEAPPSASPSS